MTPRRTGLVALVALAAIAVAAVPATPLLRRPFPFEHAEHTRAFARAGLACVDCHPVGLVPTDGGPPAIDASRATCHDCHLGTAPGAPRRAPSECATCHEGRTGLLPPSHDAGWITAHGDAARGASDAASSTWGGKCADCHTPDACIECHDARGAGAREPHPPGFRTTHGVEARLDPRGCAQCHTASTCATCHLEGSLPW